MQIQAQNCDNGTDWEDDPTTGNYPKDPIEFPGERALFAMIDEGDAAAFGFPVAKILNSRATTSPRHLGRWQRRFQR